MVEVERFSASKDQWVSCLKEIIDLTDDDDAQDQKLTKLPAPPSPKKGPMKPEVYEGSKGPLSTIDGPLHVTPKVPQTPSKAESKKRKAFETPEKDGDKALVCPNAPKRKKVGMVQALERFGYAGDKATQSPNGLDQQRVRMLKASCSPVVYELLKNMGKDLSSLKQKNKALEEKVAKLTDLVHKLVGDKN